MHISMGYPARSYTIFRKKYRKIHRNIFLYNREFLYLLYNQLK